MQTDKKHYEKPMLEQCGTVTEKTLNDDCQCPPPEVCYDGKCYCQCTNCIT
jgi:hypothetical protein